MLDRLGYGLRHAWRGLFRDRGFTAIAVLSIGLGVGGNAAIFSLVDQALYRRLPAREPERLVLLSWSGRFVGGGYGSGNLLPHPMFRQLKAENTVFSGMFARHPTTVHLAVDGAPEPVNADVVSGTYFDVLGVHPAIGRLLGESDDVVPGGHPFVVLAYDYWQKRFGGDPAVLGRKVLVNRFPMTIVGVAAAGFHGLDFAEVPALFVPLMMQKHAIPDFDWLANRRGRWLHLFGRLKPGVSRTQAAAALQPWFKGMLEADTRDPSWPVVTAEERSQFLASALEVYPAAAGRSDLRKRIEEPLYVLLAATALVLLLACLNVANLSLARAYARRGDTALRLAIGASRGRIARDLLVQSAVLAGLGALAGLLVAPLVTSSLIAFLPEAVDLHPSVNPRVFLFALAVALATGLAFGVVPALHASRTPPGFHLKDESRTLAGGFGLRKALVAGQVALALVLLVGAGLFARTLHNLRARGPGFPTTNLLALPIDGARNGIGPARFRVLLRDLLASLRERPETVSASASTARLLATGSWNTSFTVDDGRRRFTVDGDVHCSAILPGFFETLGVGLLSGRGFDERDALALVEGQEARARVAVVNARFARRHLPERSPLGARLAFGTAPDAAPDIEIVGIVRDFSYRSSGLRNAEEQIFFPYLEADFAGAVVYVRTAAPSADAFAAVRAAARNVDPSLPVADLRTLDDQLDRALQNERLLAGLAGAFAALALLLAVVGLYGITSFVVTRRTREIGIRTALGATRAAAVRLVVRDTALLVGAGILVALPAAVGLGRLVESQLFGVSALDGTTLAASAALLAVAGVAAAALPARRAAGLDPMKALRYD
jgi:predicted permease